MATFMKWTRFSVESVGAGALTAVGVLAVFAGLGPRVFRRLGEAFDRTTEK